MAQPRITILTTGGTIAASAASATQTATYSLADGPDSLLDAVPQARGVADIRCERFANLPSHELTIPLLLDLARRINALLSRGKADGIVVTHGTDTLEETAYFLHLVVKSGKPVVLVGAARPSTALSADGPLNLYHAVRVAACPQAQGQGVLVLMNDRIGSARHVAKAHTSAPDAFRSPEQGFLGTITGESIDFETSPRRPHTLSTPFDTAAAAGLPRVEIVYAALGQGPHLLDAAIAGRPDGIVLAATGNGSLSESVKDAARRCREFGIAFVRSSRTGSGCVSSQPVDAEVGTITGGNLNPQKARILLMLALAVTRETGEVQRMFDTY